MFRNAMLTVLLFASMTIPAIADAAPSKSGLGRAPGIAGGGGSIVIPVEWGGIWAVEDSSYDCNGLFDTVEAGSDTLCPGASVMDSGESPIQMNCTGSADATTVNVTCSGSMEIMPDCQMTITTTLHGTRTGETYFVVSTQEITYSGTAPECGLVQGSCTQTNSHGTRTEPTPTQYCQTPAIPTTWGKLKVRYR